MRVAPWMPDKFEFQQNYPGGQQAYEQSMHQTVQNWQNQQGGPKGPRQSVLPLGLAGLFGQGGPQGGQNPLTALGLGAYQGGQGGVLQTSNGPQIQKPPQGGPQHTGIIRQPPPQGGWTQLPQGPPRQDIFGIRGMGEQIGGFGETLGGYGEQMGGFGEQLGGFGEQLGGFRDEFSNINNRLQSMEQGITSLTDKFGVQKQQPQNPFQGLSSMFFGGGGYGNPYSGYSYF